MTRLPAQPDAVDAHKLELTNQELGEHYGIVREWVRECPRCGASHPVTVYPNETEEYGLIHLAECLRGGGLMIVTLEGVS